MLSQSKRWYNLFLFCAGISVAAGFVMQWLAADFWLTYDEKFSILGLELFYSKHQIITTLKEIQQPARIALNYQLIFDFVFMAGVYPGIASLCMIAREKIRNNGLRNFLFALAVLQPLGLAFDVTENLFLLKWLEKPEIGDEFSMYHNIVAAKWLIALIGFFSAILIILFRKPLTQKSKI